MTKLHCWGCESWGYGACPSDVVEQIVGEHLVSCKGPVISCDDTESFGVWRRGMGKSRLYEPSGMERMEPMITRYSPLQLRREAKLALEAKPCSTCGHKARLALWVLFIADSTVGLEALGYCERHDPAEAIRTNVAI